MLLCWRLRLCSTSRSMCRTIRLASGITLPPAGFRITLLVENQARPAALALLDVRLGAKFKAYECESVILPIILTRPLECVFIKWREDKEAESRDARLRRGTQCPCQEIGTESSPVSKKTDWTLRKVFEEMTLRIYWNTQRCPSQKCRLRLES